MKNFAFRMQRAFAVLASVVVLNVQAAQAQDIHFSQYDHAPVFLSAGQTGLFSGDYRFAANYRSQWFSVPVPYSTFAASAEMRLMGDKLENDVFAVGVLAWNDKAGDSELSSSQAQISVAYAKQLVKGLFLYGGVYAGGGQRRFKMDRLQFDDQYTGDQFDPTRISAEQSVARNTNLAYFDVGMGLGLRWQATARTYVNAGFSMMHLNTPRQSFMSGEVELPTRLSLHAAASVQVAPRADLLLSTQFQQQLTYRSAMFGAMWRYHLNTNRGRETAVFFGSLFRLGDAVAPIIGLNYQTWQAALSYDINLSAFNVATNRHGAVELSLIYILKRLDRSGAAKVCPVL